MQKTQKRIFSISVSGVSKKISLSLIEDKTPFGVYNILDARNTGLPKAVLVKIANENNIPILSDFGKIFPDGKTARDFIVVKKKDAK
ncbi:MAG: hypothetical protein QXI89_01200 [Candidatus Anstonellales archaeon]